MLEAGYIRSAQAIHAEDAIDAFPGPVLLLHGKADNVVPLRDVAAAAERYQHCRLEQRKPCARTEKRSGK